MGFGRERSLRCAGAGESSGRSAYAYASSAAEDTRRKKPVIEGAANAAALGTSRRDARIRVDVNLVLIPATVTDPMNRLVTGLEKENFEVYDNNIGQVIKSFRRRTRR